jgi:hypothetical protein
MNRDRFFHFLIRLSIIINLHIGGHRSAIGSGVRLDESLAMARHKTFSLHADQKHHTKSLFISHRWRFELASTPPLNKF